MRAPTTTAAGPVARGCKVARSRPRTSPHSHNRWRDCRGPSTTKNSFLTPDSSGPGSTGPNPSIGVDPLTRNTYSYVNGDPINLADPSGHDPCVVDGQVRGGGCFHDGPLGSELSGGPYGSFHASLVHEIRANHLSYDKWRTELDVAYEQEVAGPGWVAGQDTTNAHCFRWGCEQARSYIYDNPGNSVDKMATAIEIGWTYCSVHVKRCRSNDRIAQIGSDLLATAYYAGGFRLTGAGALSRAAEAESGGASALEDAAQSCSVNSFTATTPVLLASGAEVPISKIHVGDKVLATDPQTGKTAARPVTNLIVHGGKHTMVDVTLADGSRLTATDHHPFWDATTRRFTYAIDLRVGEQVREANGQLLNITAVHAYDQDVTSYNLTVDGIHTYYAGTTPVLVHNSCADRVAAAVERNGGVEVENGYSFATRQAARQAASEVAGDLGSDPVAIRASEFRGGPWWMRESDMVIGRSTAGGDLGWRDDFLGHTFSDGSSLGPHVNIWEGDWSTHFFYGGSP